METYVHCTSGRRGVKPALRGWDTVTLWGELSATTGCVIRHASVRRAPGRNQKREGEALIGLQGGHHTLSPSRAMRPAPFPASFPFRGSKPGCLSPWSAAFS